MSEQIKGSTSRQLDRRSSSPTRRVCSFFAAIGLHPLILGLAAGAIVSDMAFLSQSAQAYTGETSVAVQRQDNESYEALTRRAEMAARATAQRLFDGDVLVSEVAVTVMGQDGSSIVPMLVMRVSRENWRNRPDPQQWSTYFRSARALLELGNPETAGSPATGTSPTPANTPASTPTNVPANPTPTSPTPPSPPVQRPPGTLAPAQPTLTLPGINQPALGTPPQNPARSAQPETPAQPGATSPDNSSGESEPTTIEQTPPPQINIPATPAGIGLPRSILR
ncbi:MAG TPA: hypothetical protein V6D10_11940 [Trichocoleus sp.]|jgi:hypothetical protein